MITNSVYIDQLIGGQEPIVVSKEDLTPNHQKANCQNDTQQVDHNSVKSFDKIFSGNGQPATTKNDVMDDRDVADPRQLPTGPLSLDSLSTDGRYQVIIT